MNGIRGNKDIIVEPIGVITRRSSDIIAVEDAEVAQAVIFIRENFRERIQVDDVVSATTLSRRMLELRFKNCLQKTILTEINRLQIEYSKQKLINSNDPINKIAESLAYTDPEHFARFFKKIVAISPKEFREKRG